MSATAAAPRAMSQSVTARRKMRKGTHSCSECRRRKIKCKFHPGTASPCIPCAARGSRCLDQRNATPVNESNINTESVSLRERVAVLEKMVRNHAVRHEPTLGHEEFDIEDELVEADERAPFVSMLNKAEVCWKLILDYDGPLIVSEALEESHFQITQPIQETPSRTGPPFYTQSSSEACLKLRSALPEYDLLISTLSQNGAWWSSFRQKVQVICQGTYQDLAAFAARAYTSSDPAELGMLVVAYARSTGNKHNLYGLVDRLAIPDSALSYSAEAMELLLLLAKAYSDIGQPRQSWMMYRKGLAISEVMTRNCFPSSEEYLVGFYHGDRFSSLLLGIPYGFNDAHLGPSVEPYNVPTYPEQRFVLRCASIAGKIIDRNMMPGKPSSASSMLLDEQMDTIASSMPLSWWDLPESLPNCHAETDELRNVLLLHFYFFHVRINLHLPFIVGTEMTSARSSHRLACLEASRQLLKRFTLLRTEIQGFSIFDCKTSDFVGFMACVSLILCLSQPRSDEITVPVPDEDQDLIAQVKSIFEREEKAGCKVACQCRRMLNILSGITLVSDESASSQLPDRIAIPHFGYVRRDVVQQAGLQATAGASVVRSTTQRMTAAPVVSSDGLGGLGTGSGSCNWSETVDTGICWEFGELEHFQIDDDLSSWLDTAMLDVNLEWDMPLSGFFPHNPSL
ncbi:uncharacterized protein FFUJ_12670 [Fusarium fujikuroi IMI 58289]|uniref:Zn(2)-C6 fungal-type domain-containing protein n=1 Tax=Gibberella fujikuroi (strain CBS 195.34 / IMI 58289 / NRRL A-6831) TaxID=1279085 RepID=S0EE98_GIBF5|nr:uncharacterized protein FFUJ_12670 [Fusarium fujikuroi IMI 58289]CCT73119.1 uncharacterized protein FFUJ_12670 [Fusarium fujikuroi IMI 58289]SCO25257.1 uncharacterized protein FFM5_14033 [Fusarium fujikuroi]SCO54293.1 uncharacterized protein FFMR_11734 [Fusarium fujikuroi]